MEEFVELLGWVTAGSVGVTFTNFLVKLIYKWWVNKLPKNMDWLVKPYRALMRFFIKIHKAAGVVAVLAVITHFSIAYRSEGLSSTGITAGSLLLVLFGLGIYGFFIRKSPRGLWLILHRLAAFALIITIMVHIAGAE